MRCSRAGPLDGGSQGWRLPPAAPCRESLVSQSCPAIQITPVIAKIGTALELAPGPVRLRSTAIR